MTNTSTIKIVETLGSDTIHSFDVPNKDILYIGNKKIQFTVYGLAFQAELLNGNYTSNAQSFVVSTCKNIEYSERVKPTRAYKNIDIFSVAESLQPLVDAHFYISSMDEHHSLVDKNDFTWTVTPINYNTSYKPMERYGLLIFFSGGDSYFINSVEMPLSEKHTISIESRMWFITPHSLAKKKYITPSALCAYVHKLITTNYTDDIYEEIEQQLAVIRPKRNLPTTIRLRQEYKNVMFNHNVIL